MHKYLLIYGILFAHLADAKNIKNIGLWQKVLYISAENEKEIKDPDYYFSERKTVKAEIKAFEQALIKNEKEVRCNYPLRYKLSKGTYAKSDINSFKDCDEFLNFNKELKYKRMSLFYASELLSSSASAFGHLMLALHDNETPEMNSEVIHFAADANRDFGFLDYALKGLTGEYKGYYLRTKFFTKAFEYLKVEQRYLFGHELNLTEVQKENFIMLLYELRKAHFDYFFLNENCGYRLHDLLAIILDEPRLNTSVYSLPIETIKQFKNHYKRTYSISPYEVRALNLYEKLNASEKNKLDEILNGKINLQESDSNNLKAFLFYYGQFKYQSQRSSIRNYKENFEKAKTLKVLSSKRSVLKTQKTSAVSIGFGAQKFNSNDKSITSFSYRPVLKSKLMNQFDSVTESGLELLAIKFNIIDNQVVANRFKAFEIVSLPISYKYFDKTSWSLSIGSDRENINRDLLNYTRFGYGRTYKIFGQMSFLLNMGYEANNSYDQVYLGPEIIWIKYLNKRQKLLFNYKHKYQEDMELDVLRINYSYLFDQETELVVTSEKSNEFHQSLISFNRYF